MSRKKAKEMETGGWSAGDTHQFLTDKAKAEADANRPGGRAAKGVNDGKGFVFVSHDSLAEQEQEASLVGPEQQVHCSDTGQP